MGGACTPPDDEGQDTLQIDQPLSAALAGGDLAADDQLPDALGRVARRGKAQDIP